MKMEKLILNQERNVSLVTMIQEVGGEFGSVVKRPAILVLPGGGYAMCSDREAEPVALAYAKAGYQAFILRYSVGEHKAWPNPLGDYEQAMALIRSKAEEWHIYEDKIAVIGFSAGGHLAACAATISKNRPNAAILGYAAVEKKILDMLHPELPIPGEHVDAKTCACFLFAARDDRAVAIENTVNFELALIKENISFESHVYAFGGHGFSTGEDSLGITKMCSRLPHWVQDSIEWLGDIFGKFGDKAMTHPACPGKVGFDREPKLSVYCTVGHLKKQSPETQAMLAPVFVQLDAVIASYKEKGMDISGYVQNERLQDLLQIIKVPQEQINQLDSGLTQIANIF